MWIHSTSGRIPSAKLPKRNSITRSSTILSSIQSNPMRNFIISIINFDHLTCQIFCFGPQKAAPAELVSFQELLMVNSIQINALCHLLIEKEVISQGRVFKTGTPALDSKQPGQPISGNTHDITTKRFK
jgi:hypothetical protein